MLNVFICEDNTIERNKFEKIIKDIIMIENLDMDVSLSTGNPEDILSYLDNNSVSGLYFLDIDLKNKINVLKLAEKIREYDPRGFIVFVTTHAEMSYLTFIYKVEAMDYIIKDNYNNDLKGFNLFLSISLVGIAHNFYSGCLALNSIHHINYIE